MEVLSESQMAMLRASEAELIADAERVRYFSQ